MNSRLFKIYNNFRNHLYHNKAVLKVYSFFRSDIPDKKAARKLKMYGWQDLDVLFKIIDEQKICAFCDFGTLLGFIREKDFIAHDNDIDLGVMNDSEFDWAKLKTALLGNGMSLVHSYSYEGMVTEETYMFSDGLTVDFFLYDIINNNEMQTYVYYKDHSKTYSNKYERSVKALIYPLINNIEWYEIKGIKVLVPSNPEERLEAIYGKGWLVPDPNYVPDRKDNILPGVGEKHE